MSDWRSLNSRSPKLVPPDFSIFKNAGFLDKMQVNPDFVDGIYSRKGEKTFLVSDDGDTVLYRLILAKGKIGFYSNLLRRFYRLPERKDYFLMGLGIFGIKSRQHKVLCIAPPNHTISFEKIRWSGDSSCIVLAQSRFENGESPDIFKVIWLKK
jgi:hypothetical protein